MKSKRLPLSLQRGATLIEVLVSMLILMFGLLGLVGVMVQSQRAQVEAFQREQALLIAQDMVNRMSANKNVATCYQLTDYLGVDKVTPPAATSCTAGATAERSRFATDMSEWLGMLQGASTAIGTNSVGGVPDARGCITQVGGLYQVSVAWQGSAATSAPPAGVTCGKDKYNASGDTSDTGRRAVSLTVLL